MVEYSVPFFLVPFLDKDELKLIWAETDKFTTFNYILATLVGAKIINTTLV